ncbi:DNA-methyltransferase [Pajaroellobacter abortibovis]|uniref:Methyltransferase n=1 Tax=Pajaroellobacter abortibovis TaxID=1882918 RepID=A0A1L6MZ82_9BACT|nr:site-specific DNA-methyltransferase [Pajaroellobacter abortibovis]APS00832.1 DNA methyltransferase [Pajaroellobacter abortibovis]
MNALISDLKKGKVYYANNLSILEQLPTESIDLIYIDPPFNTGREQSRFQLQTVQCDQGDRLGFGGRRYKTVALGSSSFSDDFEDYLGFLEPRFVHAHRLLKRTGSFYFHIDYREVHYCKVLLDRIFGRSQFINEIIWAYDYGGKTKKRWPPKHDTILFYVKDNKHYFFDGTAVDRIPYMSPSLVGAEKAERGKYPTDTWWHTIVSPTGKEKLGYPTQKPLGILRRIVCASCPEGGIAFDFFAGSGTLGEVALKENRRFILVDINPYALQVMKRRFSSIEGVEFFEPGGALNRVIG